MRDIPTDIEAGKLTMAVRLGERWSRITYIVEMALALGLGVLLLDENPLVPADLPAGRPDHPLLRDRGGRAAAAS